jgi:beta-galactosidase
VRPIVVTAHSGTAGQSGTGGRGVRLVPGGLQIDGAFVPLTAGSVHYWRLDPRDWRACLEATRNLGIRLVDVYIPWGVHEITPGRLELGQGDPQRDVAAFLRLAHEVDLYAIIRPGPHINAELTYFGLPERIIWDPSCQARSPRNHPVMLPMLPVAFPVPSYASEAFLDEAARYFRLLAPSLVPLLYPNGPIVLVQIDNEGALYFRDGAYDQDYHPDAITLYRSFLREKYGAIEALEAAYGVGPKSSDDGAARGGSEPQRFAAILPPTRFDGENAKSLARHLDWAEFHEHLLATCFTRFVKALAAAGIEGLPTSHNLPPGQEATPLNAARVTRSVDLVGLDYYYRAGPQSRSIISRRTSELAVRCEGLKVPAFACEMGAGFPPFFPPLSDRDSIFTLLAALAYGLRGFNIYMAVERDRWIGAPIDPRGRPRPFAAFYRKLTAALEGTSFFNLHRRTPVRILTPRSERRLARVLHAFGPISGAFFSVTGGGARECASEQDFGLGCPIGIEADTFARTLELALEARGVPFAHIGGEDRDISLDGARWLICATSGGMNPELFRRLEQQAQAGTLITLGPREPLFDGAFRPFAQPLDPARLKSPHHSLPLVLSDAPADADDIVARAIVDLKLPTFACDPDGVFVTVHEDESGRPRVLFILNPHDSDVIAKVGIGITEGNAVDVLNDATFEARRGTFDVRMQPHTVRMLALAE